MTQIGTTSLTPTERQVVELVCRGLTNPQIAAELFIEPSTVRWHLKNVFRKLGVRTRTELAAYLLNGMDRSKSSRDRATSPTSVGQAKDQPKRTPPNNTK